MERWKTHALLPLQLNPPPQEQSPDMESVKQSEGETESRARVGEGASICVCVYCKHCDGYLALDPGPPPPLAPLHRPPPTTTFTCPRRNWSDRLYNRPGPTDRQDFYFNLICKNENRSSTGYLSNISPPAACEAETYSQSVAGGWWLYNLAWSAGGLQECGFHVADCLSAYVQYYFHHNHHQPPP